MTRNLVPRDETIVRVTFWSRDNAHRAEPELLPGREARRRVAQAIRQNNRRGYRLCAIRPAPGEFWFEFAAPDGCGMIDTTIGDICVADNLAECCWCGAQFAPDYDARQRGPHYCSPCCWASFSGRECDCSACNAYRDEIEID